MAPTFPARQTADMISGFAPVVNNYDWSRH
jgi:hypothetical protein